MSPLALAFALMAALAAPPSTTDTPLQQNSSIAPEIPLQRHSGLAAGWQAYKVIQAAARDKQGRITVSCPVVQASIDEKAFQGKKGSLLLQDPTPQVSIEAALKNPQLRDRLEIRLAPAVVNRLKRLGIRDVEAHFKGCTVKATGKSVSTLYLCMPAISVTTVIVERIEDIEVIGEKDPLLGS